MRVYGNSKMLSLLGLGVASGLPLFLVQRNLQAWLTKADVDLGGNRGVFFGESAL